MRKREWRGFTLIEVMVIVAIIGILVTIAVVGMSMYQGQARDSQRAANATAISEALEKYYLENGEYPAVNALVNNNSSNTAAAISSRLKINEDSLKMPQSTTPQSIAPAGTETGDVITYDGQSTVNNNSCQTETTNAGCDRYTLTYKTEGGETVVINSRYNGARTATVAIAPDKPVISVGSGGGTNVSAQLSDPNCADNADRLVAKYAFQSRVNNGAWGNWTNWQTAKTLIIPGTEGQTIEVRGQTRCDDGDVAGKTSPVSDPDSYVIPAGAPTAPMVSVALSGSNVVATIAATSCPANYTTQYNIRSRTNNGTWSAYGGWSTAMSASQAATQGVKYGYQAQARCYSTSNTSASSTSTEGVYTHPFQAPGTPSVSQSTSGASTTFTIGAVTCPSNATTRYQYRYLADWGYTSAWYGPYSTKPAPVWTTDSQGYQYTTQAQAQCYNTYSTSPWGGTGQATYERPIDNPSNTAFNAWRGDWRTIYLSGTTTCGKGVYPDMRADVHTWDWSWTPQPPQRYGWYRNFFGSWVVNNLTYYGTTITTGSQSNSPQGIPGGTRWNIAVEKRCRNQTTGRATGIFYQESGAYAL